jgi:predicted nucleic acid-binding protein
MSARRGPYVVDASAGIKLFLPEAMAWRAHALFQGLQADPPIKLCVPELFFIECANVLWKHVRRGTFSAEVVVPHLSVLLALPLEVTPTRALCASAFGLANRYGITAYDACYVALAQQLGAPLITADEALARLLPDMRSQILLLKDLPLPVT